MTETPKCIEISECISTDYTQFAEAIVEHLYTKHPSSRYHSWRKITCEMLVKEPHFAKLLEPAQPGDTLDYWEYDAGFCATGNGYAVKRNGEMISSTMFSCS